MPGDSLQASYGEMKDIATAITQLSEEYQGEIKAIYEVLDGLEASWEGIDNKSYINTAKSYEKDLLALGTALDNYGKFLNGSADLIAKTQEEIANQAGR